MNKINIDKYNFNLEENLLISLINTSLKNEITVNIDEENINWEYFLKIATYSNLSLPIFNTMKKCNIKIDNTEITNSLDAYYKLKVFSCLNSVNELTNILRIFHEKRIEYSCFKGPVLSQLIYDSYVSREFDDLDIFIKKDDYNKVKNILLSNGYFSTLKLNEFLESKFISDNYYYNYSNSKKSVDIDIHWFIDSKNLSFSFSFDELKDDLAEVDLNDLPVKTFNLENTIILLILHGSKHAWSRLNWIYDLAALICKFRDLNWEYILSSAKKRNFLIMLLVSCNITKILFESKIPENINNLIHINKKVNYISKKILRNLFDCNRLYEESLYLQSMDNYSDKSKYILNHLKPTSAEYSYNFPNSLYNLYYPFRILRLVTKQAKKYVIDYKN